MAGENSPEFSPTLQLREVLGPSPLFLHIFLYYEPPLKSLVSEPAPLATMSDSEGEQGKEGEVATLASTRTRRDNAGKRWPTTSTTSALSPSPPLPPSSLPKLLPSTHPPPSLSTPPPSPSPPPPVPTTTYFTLATLVAWASLYRLSRKQSEGKFAALQRLKEARKEGRKMNYEVRHFTISPFHHFNIEILKYCITAPGGRDRERVRRGW